MRKIALLVPVLLFIASFSVFAKTVEINSAKIAGKNFFYQRLTIHLAQTMDYNDIKISGEYVEKTGDIPLYYVFNFSGKGYIIVSADDCCFPVIGYSFESHYDPDNKPENFSYWMDLRKQEIAQNIQNNIAADEAISGAWDKIRMLNSAALTDGLSSVTDVAPLVTSTWDQGFPYNVLCPADPNCGSFGGHVTVGCVATAMAQIMYYWRWPNTGSGSHCYTPAGFGQQCADYGNTTYDWNGMADSPSKECYPIALISYHAGVSVNMMYNSDGACSSGAYQSSVPAALETYFKYSTSCLSVNKMSYATSAWNDLLQGDLNSGKPIQYGGQGPGGGHSWICDGYQGADFYHMNWGWSGSSNGYFYLSNLNPSGSTFNNSQSAVVHIEPNTSQYPSFCSGSTIVDTYDYGTIEDGSGPVGDYQNSADCSWLIAPDDSAATVTLNFSQFNTVSGDVVKVYDGADVTSPLIGTFSGALSVMPTVTSTGPQMFVTFTTDGSATGPGWKAGYTANLVKFCASSTTLLDGWGTITDGSDRFDYRNNSNCKWKIMPAGASKIVLTPVSFNTEENNDRIQVYDLGTSTLLATWSGNSLPAPLESTTGSVMLIWTSNGSVRGSGWEISYSPMVGVEEVTIFNDLVVFPNPASGLFNIEFTIHETQGVIAELLSLQGAVLWEDNLRFFKGHYAKTIDVSGFQSGIYMLRLRSDKGTSVKKIVIQ